jgi:glycosyltransferase involved in cell wall biosynthesis
MGAGRASVQVLAADYSHVRTRQPACGDELDRRHRLPLVRHARPTAATAGPRAKQHLGFLRAVWHDTPRIVREFKPDVVIASSTYPMDIWVARRLARQGKARLVYEVHDLWPLSPVELAGMSPRHPFIQVCQRAEEDAYRDADVVVSMLPCVHEHMASHGLDLRKLHIVPNGITLDEWEGTPPALDTGPAMALAAARAAGTRWWAMPVRWACPMRWTRCWTPPA